MRFMKPQKLQPKYYEPIEREIKDLFYTIFYGPIVSLIKQETGQNARLNARVQGLLGAIRNGKVQYTVDKTGKGVFSPGFGKAIGAVVGKELRDMGATFDSRSGVYHIDQTRVPAEIKSLSSLAQQKAKDMNENLARLIDTMSESMDDVLEKAKIDTNSMMFNVTSDFNIGVRDVGVLPPELTEDAKIRLADDYTRNMKLYIRKWSDEHIESLREVVEKNAMHGYRFDHLIGLIRDAHNVSQNKAEFLARQETGLFTAKFRKERLGDIGVHYYKWSGRSAKLTRPDHWRHNGKIFSYDQPPVVDDASGRRGNPGEDFNCLCSDIPVLGRVAVAV
jgi:SPP1 gp7 family putative phage head morphogenesis protein